MNAYTKIRNEMVGEWIERERRARDLEPIELALMIGVSEGRMREWERGDASPSLHALERMRLVFEKIDATATAAA